MTSSSVDATFLKEIDSSLGTTAFIIDIEKQTLVWLNDFGIQKFGYSLKELQDLKDQYLPTIVHPDDRVYIAAFLKRVGSLEDHNVTYAEYRIRDKEGRYHWLQYRIGVHKRKPNGEVLTIAGTGSDAQAPRAYEQKLRTNLEKLNFSLASANMGTWEWDLENDRVVWNDRMYALHGADPEKVLRVFEHVNAITLPEDLNAMQSVVEEALLLKKDFQVDYRIRKSSGEIRHIRCYGKFIQDHSTMYGVARDFTDELETEQEVAEAKAKMIASAKMAALGEMSGGIAHEINNPLTVIQARAFQLNQMVEREKLDAGLLKKAADSISHTADKIARIIKSLLSFAREADQDAYGLVPVSQILDETLEFCKARFHNHGIDVRILGFDTEIEVECQLVQIEQVLLNLLSNSYDAIQDLPEKWIEIQVQEANSNIEIRITDSGKGIDKDLAEKIMLPFFTTKAVGKGTGLGLSISTGILNSHGGSISLDRSSENTSFVIKLPKWQTLPE